MSDTSGATTAPPIAEVGPEEDDGTLPTITVRPGEGAAGSEGEGEATAPNAPVQYPPPEGEAKPPVEEERESLRRNYQGSRTRAFCRIVIGDGLDVTRWWDPYLISVEITDKVNDTDEATIELDDRNAQLPVVPPKTPIRIELGWQREALLVVFTGLIMECESGFGRKAGGRRMWLECKGYDTSGPAKQPTHFYEGEGEPPAGGGSSGGVTGGGGGGGPGGGAGPGGGGIPLGSFFPKAAALSGLQGIASGSLGAAIKRDYWAMTGESFLHWGRRISQETGMFFKISNVVKATLTDARSDRNAAGERMGAVLAEWGLNLIIWRIKPFVSRPYHQSAAAEHFNFAGANWKSLLQAIKGGGPFSFGSATAMRPGAAPNAQVGGQWAQGMEAYSENERTVGHVIINGEPSALAQGTCIIWGARPGVDGRYMIIQAEHIYTRGGGYVTRCTLRRGEFAGGGSPTYFPGGEPTTEPAKETQPPQEAPAPTEVPTG